jgi:gliding motility-associated-like protein
MKAQYYTFLFCLLAHLLHGQCGTWQAATSASTQNLNAVHFPDSLRGWAVGRNGTIIATTNGGANWSAPQSTGTTEILYGVHMVNSTLGWAVGAGGTVLKTTNGTSWALQNNLGTDADLFDIWFSDTNNGLIVGSCGTLLRTTNGGTTWNAINNGQGDYNLKQIKVLPNGRSAVCGIGNDMLYATSAGGAWSVSTASARGMRAFDMEAGGTALAATYTGEIIKSTNFGQSYSAVTPPTGTNYWQSISMVSANEAVIAGLQGKVFRTTNGGTSWTAFNTNIGTTDIYGLQMWNGNLGWAVGTGGKIFRYVAANLPTATATASTLCTGGAPATLTGSSNTTGVAYAWSAGATSTGTNIATITAAGTYTVTVTNPANGCTNTGTVSVVGTPAPTLSIPSIQLTCAAPTDTLIPVTNATNATYTWFGPGINNITAPFQVINQTGTYAVTVTNTANGCSASVQGGAFVIASQAQPNISVAANNLGVLNCAFSSITLSANSITPNVIISGGTTTASTSQVSQPGTYTFTVTNPANGCTATATQIITQDIQAPDVNATGGVLSCTLNTLTILGSSQTAGVSFAWTGPSNFTSTLQNPQITEPGTYTVTATAPNQCTATAQAQVSADQSYPTSMIIVPTGQPVLNCTTSSLALNGSSSTPQVTYFWTGPGIVNASAQNQNISQPGAYTLLVRSTTNGCTDSQTLNITQDLAQPQLAPTASASITCTNFLTTIQANPVGTITAYNWAGVGITTANQTLANPVVNQAGNYSVTATGTNGCTGTASVLVSLSTTPPNASATSGQITCQNNGFTTLGSSSSTPGVTYQWSGPGLPITAMQDINVNQAGIYTVTITGSNGCTSTATAQATNALPQVAFAGNTNICLGLSTTLSVTSGSSWAWSQGSTGSSITVSPSANTTYTVTLTDNFMCSATGTIQVTVTQPFAAQIAVGNTNGYCSGQTAVLAAAPLGMSNYAWSGPGGFGATGQQIMVPNLQASPAAGFSVTITDAGGCQSTAQLNISVLPSPSVSISAPQVSLCEGQSVTLTASQAANYAWNNGLGTGQTLQLYYDKNDRGTYDYVLATTSSNGCVGTDSITIEVLDRPEGTISGDSILCIAESSTLAAGGGNVYIWQNGSTLSQIALTPGTDTPLRLIVGHSANTCRDTIYRTVYVRQPPKAIAAPDTIVCATEAILRATAQPGSLGFWDINNNADIDDQNAAVTRIADLPQGITQCIWRLSNDACPGTSTDTLLINRSDATPATVPDQYNFAPGATEVIRPVANDDIQGIAEWSLNVLQGLDSIDWQLDTTTGDISLTTQPGFSGLVQFLYEVCNTTCLSACDTAQARVLFQRLEDLTGETVSITPNGDGKNDVLIFDHLDKYPDNSITVFNRWGQQVHYAKPYQNSDPWDGTFRGNPLPAGTYYYILNLEGEDDLVWGNVLLLR